MKNQILKYTKSLFKSDYLKTHPELLNDFTTILNGNCIYLPNFFCNITNYDIILDLAKDLESNMNSGMITWSKHFKYDNPDFSKTFTTLVNQMADYFDIEIYHTRLNFYKDGSDWKPFHHDSHAYGNKSLREDFTIGASFGASRELAILHDKTKQEFRFPQNNGDIFAFTSKVNQLFQHGVPKSTKIDIGPRFSIIVWGRRKSLNERNSGKEDLLLNIPEIIENKNSIPQELDNYYNNHITKNIELNGIQIMEMVNNMIEQNNKRINKMSHKNRKNKGRIQSGWNK